jgi:hypothetical protein
VIRVDCNQMSKENTLVLTKCYHYRKKFEFCHSAVSRLRIGEFPGIECKWLVLLSNDGSNLFGILRCRCRFQRELRSLGSRGQLRERGDF